MSSVKVCACCASEFSRPYGLSETQWVRRLYCSKRCAMTRRLCAVADIAAMYAGGESSVEIAARVGISDTQVRRILSASGVSMRDASENKKLSHARPSVKAKLSVAHRGRSLPEKAKEKLRALTGPRSPLWNAGITMSAGGYLSFTNSPANGVHAGRLLHQVLAEFKIGRPIHKGEHVHHVDGNKLNNDPANLQVLSASEHTKLHWKQRRAS